MSKLRLLSRQTGYHTYHLTNSMKIVVDAMGGDHAPSEVVQGALNAVSDDSEIEIILTGDEEKINDSFPPSIKRSSITIHHTSQTVEMTDRPLQVIKQKPNSSLVAGIEMIKSGKARAFVSAGSTGAILAASLLLLGRIEGVKRPALGVFFPSGNNGLVLCDAGASSEAKPEHLLQFAIMASEYMSHIQGVHEPKIGLLNIGVEETKVTDESNFIDDLGADSLDTVELVMAFEEEFGSVISDSEAEKILTVGDAIKFIESKAT